MISIEFRRCRFWGLFAWYNP